MVRILAGQNMGQCCFRGQANGDQCAGADAWATPLVQARQAYVGRAVTMTRNRAGTMSSRSIRSAPILCITPQPQGQIRLSDSIISSILGNEMLRVFGSLNRPISLSVLTQNTMANIQT